MAFSGYMIKLKKGNNIAELPLTYMAVESYHITPNQRMEAKANRATSGVLVRQTVSHTATKIEFETPPCTNREAVALNTLFQSYFSSSLERKLIVQYYDPETDAYKEGTFYMPDAQYDISRVDTEANMVYYDKIRFAFIEY